MKRIFARLFTQGFYHERNIASVYSLVREVCNEEFTEDNVATRDDHLNEIFQSTQGVS